MAEWERQRRGGDQGPVVRKVRDGEGTAGGRAEERGKAEECDGGLTLTGLEVNQREEVGWRVLSRISWT
eukprot:1311142-Rhodomonas_salina.1